MWGNQRWSPDEYLRARHPEVDVHETDLPGRLQGFIERDKGIVWLSVGLTPVERRCCLAYEIAQLEQGPTPGDPCLAAARERAAADWAARMLIDFDDMADAFTRCRGYGEIAALLEVDVPTVRARLRGLTDAEQDAVLEAIHRLRLTA